MNDVFSLQLCQYDFIQYVFYDNFVWFSLSTILYLFCEQYTLQYIWSILNGKSSLFLFCSTLLVSRRTETNEMLQVYVHVQCTLYTYACCNRSLMMVMIVTILQIIYYWILIRPYKRNVATSVTWLMFQLKCAVRMCFF